jgi:hypothetical protein
MMNVNCLAKLNSYSTSIAGVSRLQEKWTSNYLKSTFNIFCKGEISINAIFEVFYSSIAFTLPSSSYLSKLYLCLLGDVCKGDVALFDQKVDRKVRSVAGRVVKESYGAQRQQHTFTVWSIHTSHNLIKCFKSRSCRGASSQAVIAPTGQSIQLVFSEFLVRQSSETLVSLFCVPHLELLVCCFRLVRLR